MYLSERISKELEKQIQDGTFKPGSRLPSVRRLSKSFGVSVTTVLEAYGRLQDKELIYSRDRSGFFTRPPSERPGHDDAGAEVGSPIDVPFLELMLELLSERDQGRLVRLGVAQPEPEALPTEQLNRVWRRVIRSPQLKTSNYVDPLGLPALRRAIAAKMLDRGVACSADEMLITNGSQQALRIALQATMSEGDVVAVESPCYPGLLHILSELELKAVEFPCRARTGIDWRLLSESVDRFPIRGIVLTPTCANPNGSIIPLETRMKIMALANKHDLFVVEDDTNCDLAFGPDAPPSIKSFDTEDRVLYCGSFSKILGAGLRVGWLMPGDRLTKALTMKYVDDLGGPSLEQNVLAQYVRTRQCSQSLDRARRMHSRTVTEMVRCIRNSFPKGTHVNFPEGGFLLWVRLPDNVDAGELRKRALASHISIATGDLFSANQNFKNFIRLGWGGEWNIKIRRSVETLGRIAGELAEKPEIKPISAGCARH